MSGINSKLIANFYKVSYRGNTNHTSMWLIIMPRNNSSISLQFWTFISAFHYHGNICPRDSGLAKNERKYCVPIHLRWNSRSIRIFVHSIFMFQETHDHQAFLRPTDWFTASHSEACRSGFLSSHRIFNYVT